MAGMDVSYDENGKSITIWFDYPWKLHYQEERGCDLTLKKDANGHLIGVEHRTYFADDSKPAWWLG